MATMGSTGTSDLKNTMDTGNDFDRSKNTSAIATPDTGISVQREEQPVIISRQRWDTRVV